MNHKTNPENILLPNSIRRWWNDYHWSLIGMLALIVFALGVIGYALQLESSALTYTPWDLLYRSLRLFSMEFDEPPGALPWQLQIARFMAPAVLVFAALSAFVAAFHTQMQLFQLRVFRDHVVICGLGEKGYRLARSLRQPGRRRKVVAIELDAGNGRIEQARDLGIIVLQGNATDTSILIRARTARARQVYAVTGDESANAEIAVRCRDLVQSNARGQGLDCFIHIASPDLADFLNERKLTMAGTSAFRLEIFNIYATGARTLLNNFPPWPASSSASSETLHPAVIGLGRLGRAFVVELAMQWQMTRNNPADKLTVMLLDPQASAARAQLENRYPSLHACCTLDALDVKAHNPELVRDALLGRTGSASSVSHVYICTGDDTQALSTALVLRRQPGGLDVPVVVRTRYGAGLGSLIEAEDARAGGAKRIQIFSLYDCTCTRELFESGTFEIIARAIHDDYVKNQRIRGQTPASNHSMVPWEELPETLRNSSRRQAHHIGVKLGTIGCDVQPRRDWFGRPFRYRDEEIESLARLEHERWMQERQDDGWTFYPGEKNIDDRTSPYLVTWDELPDAVREYDREAVRKLPAFLARAGFDIFRCSAPVPTCPATASNRNGDTGAVMTENPIGK